MSLSVHQQKQLYDRLYQRIVELHTDDFKNDIKIFSEEFRNKNLKGIILLNYYSIKEMVESVKTKNFNYEWIPKNEAKLMQHNGITSALVTMNAKSDCVLCCSLVLNSKHLYINCTKMKDIVKN